MKKGMIDNKNFTLISDYAHHPTEVRATLKAVKEKFPDKEVFCVFQPHQYQRSFYLFKDFVRAFSEIPLKKTIITNIYDVAGREEKGIREKVSSKKMVEEIDKAWVGYLPKSKIKNYLKRSLKGGEIVVIMGAGDIYTLIDEFST